MSRTRMIWVTVLVVVSFATPWGLSKSLAQSQGAVQGLADPTTLITDVAGRVHQVMPMRSTTQADRKAAAERLKATRAREGVDRNQTVPNSQGEVAK